MVSWLPRLVAHGRGVWLLARGRSLAVAVATLALASPAPAETDPSPTSSPPADAAASAREEKRTEQSLQIDPMEWRRRRPVAKALHKEPWKLEWRDGFKLTRKDGAFLIRVSVRALHVGHGLSDVGDQFHGRKSSICCMGWPCGVGHP